ncbi:MAG TPA: NAD-dependent epimerase/dehydratase family protein [Pseudobacteroides sp.]|uniref:polysaccharide biosynthesis C-terminal domain-containing protein n=1 Tax=Pseudobacteroides sp. TaxID=1968840 RepID=UPI002F926B9A
MRNVLITGAGGFIGKNLKAALETYKDIRVYSYDVENSMGEMDEYIENIDFVFHLAGINRPDDVKGFETGNCGFTEKLLGMLYLKGKKVPVLLSSSIQAEKDNPYGISKKKAEDFVFEYGEKSGSKVLVYRLPNVFGKFCRPNYNSVVATWCYNIARGIPVQINDPDTLLNLVYIDDVIEEFVNALNGAENRSIGGYCTIRRVFTVTLGQLADQIYLFKETEGTIKIPSFEKDFDRFLYATYTSYIPKEDMAYALDMKCDNRGWLAEFMKSKQTGQIFISRTKPGITRGNHWHHTKVEKFLVIEGEAVVRLRGINDTEVIEYKVSGDKLKVIDIPVGYTHSISNTGDKDLITVFWANEIFNPDVPDTYFMEV